MVAIYGDKIKMRKIKEDKTLRKSNKDNKFPPLTCSSWKTDVWNEYTKTKGLYHASKYLIRKRLPEWKSPS